MAIVKFKSLRQASQKRTVEKSIKKNVMKMGTVSVLNNLGMSDLITESLVAAPEGEQSELKKSKSSLDDILNLVVDENYKVSLTGPEDKLNISEGKDDAAPPASADVPKKNKRKQTLGRRNIRNIIDTTNLSGDVQEAQRAETERLKRKLENDRQTGESQLQSLLGNGVEPAEVKTEEIEQPEPKTMRLEASRGSLANITSTLPFSSLNKSTTPSTFPTSRAVKLRSEVRLPPSVLPPASMRFSGSLPVKGARLSSSSHHKEVCPPGYKMTASGLIYKSVGHAGYSMDDAILLEDSDDEDEDDDMNDESGSDDYREIIELSDGDDDEEVDEEARQDADTECDEEGRIAVNRYRQDVPCYLSNVITKNIKPHQVSGIRFLYDNVVENLEQFESQSGFGCILAHSMGLGKTIQVIGFLEVLFRCVGARSVLVIVPINTLQNWQAEIDMWIPEVPASSNSEVKDEKNTTESCPTPPSIDHQSRPFTLHVVKDTLKTMESRHQVVKAWEVQGGVLLVGYEMFRLLVGKRAPPKRPTAASHKKPICIDVDNEEKKANMWSDFYSALVNPGPQVVICDEGHRIKNSEASISKALKSIKTHRRVVLTGYPLQNNLIEYWCMVDFVRPNYLGTKQNFTNMFQRPIENGQCIDSTLEDRKLMQGRAHVLHELLDGFVQRRSHAVLRHNLPPKREFVLLVKMSPVQRNLYSTFMESLSGRGLFGWAQNNTLNTYAVCCKIWNHPDILWRIVQDHKFNTDSFDFDIDDPASNSTASSTGRGGGGNSGASTPVRGTPRSSSKSKRRSGLPPIRTASPSTSISGSSVGGGAEGGTLLPPYPPPTPSQSSASSSAANLAALDTSQDSLYDNPYVAAYMASNDNNSGINYDWITSDLWPNYEPENTHNGGKIVVFFALLRECISMGDKMLLFSQSLLTLDLIEDFLKKTEAPKNIDGWKQGDIWSKNGTYYRLDGSTSASERERLINNFNDPNGKAKLFLLSTRAGCLGVNLVGANRVVVFDASWNPCHDCQAVCRVYRYGQKKTCYIYRLVTDNTMEKKIYDRQISKQGMSDRVVDEMNPDQQFTRQQVEQLVDYRDVDLPTLSQKTVDQLNTEEDPALLKVIKENRFWITKAPFTHESLLIDRKDYRLTKAEKMRAKQRYEEEKRQNQMYQRPMYMDYFPRAPLDLPPMDIRSGPRIMSRNSQFNHSSFSQELQRQNRLASFTRQMEVARARLSGIRKPEETSTPSISSATTSSFAVPQTSKAGSVGTSSPLDTKNCKITRIQATTDLFFPGTTTVSTSQRKIQKGEMMEVIQTLKGKYLRVPRTGDLYVVRTNPTVGANTSTTTVNSTTLSATKLSSPNPVTFNDSEVKTTTNDHSTDNQQTVENPSTEFEDSKLQTVINSSEDQSVNTTSDIQPINANNDQSIKHPPTESPSNVQTSENMDLAKPIETEPTIPSVVTTHPSAQSSEINKSTEQMESQSPVNQQLINPVSSQSPTEQGEINHPGNTADMQSVAPPTSVKTDSVNIIQSKPIVQTNATNVQHTGKYAQIKPLEMQSIEQSVVQNQLNNSTNSQLIVKPEMTEPNPPKKPARKSRAKPKTAEANTTAPKTPAARKKRNAVKSNIEPLPTSNVQQSDNSKNGHESINATQQDFPNTPTQQQNLNNTVQNFNNVQMNQQNLNKTNFQNQNLSQQTSMLPQSQINKQSQQFQNVQMQPQAQDYQNATIPQPLNFQNSQNFQIPTIHQPSSNPQQFRNQQTNPIPSNQQPQQFQNQQTNPIPPNQQPQQFQNQQTNPIPSNQQPQQFQNQQTNPIPLNQQPQQFQNQQTNPIPPNQQPQQFQNSLNNQMTQNFQQPSNFQNTWQQAPNFSSAQNMQQSQNYSLTQSLQSSDSNQKENENLQQIQFFHNSQNVQQPTNVQSSISHVNNAPTTQQYAPTDNLQSFDQSSYIPNSLQNNVVNVPQQSVPFVQQQYSHNPPPMQQQQQYVPHSVQATAFVQQPFGSIQTPIYTSGQENLIDFGVPPQQQQDSGFPMLSSGNNENYSWQAPCCGCSSNTDPVTSGCPCTCHHYQQANFVSLPASSANGGANGDASGMFQVQQPVTTSYSYYPQQNNAHREFNFPEL